MHLRLDLENIKPYNITVTGNTKEMMDPSIKHVKNTDWMGRYKQIKTYLKREKTNWMDDSLL